MAGALLIGLRGLDQTQVMQKQVPETAVEQVQRGVLHAAVVPVQGHEVVQRLLAGERLVVMRVAVAQEVPLLIFHHKI